MFTSTDNSTFTNLVSKAQDFSRDGKISTNEKKKLSKEALENDGKIDEQESVFLEGIENSENVRTLSESSFNPTSFSLKFNEAPKSTKSAYRSNVEPDKDPTDPTVDRPVSGTEVNDTGRAFDDIMNDPNVTVQSLKEDIMNSPLVKSDKQFKMSIISLRPYLSQDKEGLMYIRAFLDRDIPKDQKLAALNKLNEMVRTNTYDSSIPSKTDFVTSLLHDIARPSDISQGEVPSCVATSIQSQLATRNPVRYLEMADTLAQNKEFEGIKPNFTFSQEGVNGAFDSKRSISSKLMQNSFMDFSNGNSIGWDSSGKDPNAKAEGTYNEEILPLMNTVLGKDFAKQYEVSSYTPNELVQIVKNSNPSSSNPISVSLNYASSGSDTVHNLNVIGIEGDKVTLTNPWGREETFPISELENRITSIETPASNPDTGFEKISDESLAQQVSNAGSISSLVSNNPSVVKNLSLDQKMKIVVDIMAKSNPSNEELKVLREINNSLKNGSPDQQDIAISNFYGRLEALPNPIDQYDIKNKLRRIKE
jgi:hypothetical protein